MDIIGQGDETPGRWVEVDGRPGRIWQGTSTWQVRHGDARVEYCLGKAVAIYGAIMEDGTTLDRVEVRSAMDHDVWRRPNPTGQGFVLGEVTIEPNGVVFRDQPTPEFSSEDEGEAPDLFNVLAGDSEFRQRIADDRFAYALNDWFKNRDFRPDGSDRRWSCSWRRGARFIADVRELGEGYTDFYPYGGEYGPEEQSEVIAMIARLGWHDLTVEEMEADHNRALELLALAESRPAGEQPEWTLPSRRNPDAPASTPRKRAWLAAVEGRLSQEEWHLFCELYNYGKEQEIPEVLLGLRK